MTRAALALLVLFALLAPARTHAALAQPAPPALPPTVAPVPPRDTPPRVAVPRITPDTDADFLPWDHAWPARLTPPPQQANQPLRGVIRVLDNVAGWNQDQRAWTSGLLEPTPDDWADAAALLAPLGLTPSRTNPSAPGTPPAGETRVRFERSGAFVVRTFGPEARTTRGRDPDAAAWMVFVSAVPASAPAPARTPAAPEQLPPPAAVVIQRTWFAYYDPAPAPDGTPRAPRGVVLIMPGLLGTPRGTFELAFTAMRQRGWAVLRMLAQPSRFLERSVLVLDADDLEGTAQRIARDYSDRSAECAFAVEAAFAHVETIRPALAGLPRVALGGSGGAMTLPTVVARQPDRYAAAVMLAGGADLWLITSRSNYAQMIGATALRYRDRALTDDEHRRLDELYLQHAPLDPFHTAKALHGKHVLMLHGQGDLAVPADLGDVLWERLNRPERWSFPVGHELLFMGLPSQFPRILDWLDAALPPPAHTAPAPARSAPPEGPP